MPRRPIGAVFQQLRALVAGPIPSDESDGCLLERFVHQRDDAAFAALVQRHGSLVLGVCRRVLQDSHAADDAFQATFLVLLRRAAALDRRGSLSGWLYGVAYRVALRARAQSTRWRASAAMPDMAGNQEQGARELRGVLDRELQQLPDKYRLPLVLCHLQGKTHEEAARELGWPRGSLAKRLARGQELLRGRLTRCGLVLNSTVVALCLAEEAKAIVPGPLAQATLAAARPGAVVVTTVTPLVEGVLNEMFRRKLLVVSVVVLVLSAAGSGMAFVGQRLLGSQTPNAASKADDTTQPLDDLAAFKSYLEKNYKDKKWQHGPTRIDSEALRTTYGKLRFYYVRSSPPLPPGANLPDLIARYKRDLEEYRKGDFISLTVSIDDEARITPVGDFNRGLKKIAGDDDARTAAVAILSLANPGSFPTAKNLQVTRNDQGWTCKQAIGGTGNDTVHFNPDGMCTGISRTGVPTFPPSALPR
jgi:RNA polymerase sigma factor (sigma-70 family)